MRSGPNRARSLRPLSGESDKGFRPPDRSESAWHRDGERKMLRFRGVPPQGKPSRRHIEFCHYLPRGATWFPEASPESAQVWQYLRAFDQGCPGVFSQYLKPYKGHPAESSQKDGRPTILGSPASATVTFAFRPSRSRFSVIREARLGSISSAVISTSASSKL